MNPDNIITYPIKDVAAELDMSERELFAFLRDCGLIDRSHANNRPTTKARRRGWLVGKATDYTRGQTGAREQYIRPLFTERGRSAIAQLLTWRQRRMPFVEQANAIAHTLLDTQPPQPPNAPPPDELRTALIELALADRALANDKRDKATTHLAAAMAALMRLSARKNLPVAAALLDIADAAQQTT